MIGYGREYRCENDFREKNYTYVFYTFSCRFWNVIDFGFFNGIAVRKRLDAAGDERYHRNQRDRFGGTD
jgi:hypothetical protein